MRQTARCMMVALVVGGLALPAVTKADEGLIGGIDLGVAVPVGKTKDRLDTGGAASPFVGYMFNNVIGLMGQIQFAGFPNDNRPGTLDQDSTLALGGHVGPRLALPFTIGGVGLEPYGTWQGGVFTGLVGNTPVSRTSWGYSAGGGVNVRLTDEFLVGGFARFNDIDQRVAPGHNVQYVTAGIGLTYNVAAKPTPAPVVAAAPAPTPAPVPMKKKIVLRGVQFDFDKAVIRADAKPILDEAASTLKHEGTISVVAEGNTDSRGTEQYNQKLSERRAAAVKGYLVKTGISASRIDEVGKGESNPVASNDTDDGRAQNRRVELRIR